MLGPAFQTLYGLLITEKAVNETMITHLLDSMPIVVANQKRSNNAKSAKELCSKGYRASKNMYYYGAKLHSLGQKCYGTLPQMRMVEVTPASENDLTVAKRWLSDVKNIDIYADKAYADDLWKEELRLRNVNLFTPVKLEKGQEFLDSADSLLSSAVSSVRQAIESFFSWIQSKTNIHLASNVRSTQGLIAFIFARLASLAFFYC